MKTIILVSCVGRKKQNPSPAKFLYCSDWFLKAYELVVLLNKEWFILSALHGLLHPDKIIDPYNLTLKKLPKKNRLEWSENVFGELKKILEPGDEVIIFAGESYREFLEEKLINFGAIVKVPMYKLPIGKQLQWFKNTINKIKERVK